MTRQEIITAALAEVRGSSGARTLSVAKMPRTLSRWVDDVVRDMTRTSDSLWLTYLVNITSGTQRYCLPDLYEIEGVRAKLSATRFPVGEYPNGHFTDLILRRSDQMDVLVPNWRSPDVESKDPVYGVFEGVNEIALYPPPDYTTTGNPPDGLAFRGFGTHPEGFWPNLTDECPLLYRAHSAIVQGLAEKIAKDARDFTKAADCHSAYFRERGFWQSENDTLIDARRHKTSVTTGPYVASGPLNR